VYDTGPYRGLTGVFEKILHNNDELGTSRSVSMVHVTCNDVSVCHRQCFMSEWTSRGIQKVVVWEASELMGGFGRAYIRRLRLAAEASEPMTDEYTYIVRSTSILL
jgi:hypothetical protein